jgi:hypothetical protein
MKFYKVEVTLAKNKKKVEFVAAADELEAIDMCMKKYGEENVFDVKVV